jgi:tetratricopeptide (TPR) repeat protein
LPAWIGWADVACAGGKSDSDLLFRAVSAYHEGNYDLAIAEFSQLIHDGDREAYFGRAQAFFRVHDFNHAIADLNQVIQIDPSPAALELRGRAYASFADYPNATADFSRALKLQPHNADLLILRADAWFYEGKAARAYADYNQAIQLDTTNALAYAHRGELDAAYKHDYRKGVLDCLTAISVDPGCWLGYNNLAALLTVCPSAKIRDGQLALLHARRACELTHWKNPLALSVLAAACAETHDFADAIRWQQESMDEDLAMGSAGNQLALAGEKKLELYQNHKTFRAERF